MPGYYPDRVKRMLRLQKNYNIVHHGDRILELGTGWLRWEALTLRLFYDIEAVLFDVYGTIINWVVSKTICDNCALF